MPKLIAYDELSFPEIAALPRAAPLVLPLGEGQPVERLVRAARQQTGRASELLVVLPAFPAMWLQAARPVTLRRVVRSLRAALKAQGFEQYIESQVRITPTPLSVHKNKVVLIAVGHIEQHGYHLPVSTDTLIIDAIAHGVQAALPDQVLRAPTLPYGIGLHVNQFPGTLTIHPRAWEDWVLELVGTFVEQGFDKFYLINGHGGNHSFLVNVVKYAGDRWPHIFCATSFLHLTATGYEAVRRLRASVFPGGLGHACELETSFILHLRPDLVKMERAVDETSFIATPEYYMDWLEGGALIANPPWTDDTRSGAYGQPSLATAEKGAAWLQAAIKEKVAHVREIIEQHERRLARRAEWWGGRIGRWSPPKNS